ncbi:MULTISPECIES: GNAT family N-acetyltransferase [Exiguobacterium]|uniref:Ribosomal-protein-alanine N-acetyltransferase n=1 Tax=Exiguobacterium aurantiacum TaxID=33987 RepID=A0A377FR35_9BACL|nr:MULTISPECIES: GNAT family N-acetyltransferase [Exiguobacterium]STO07297.1 ribosomal-protein-alanine N-acetyltransferase [Exiguobacterium aurantiacum]
MITLGRGSVDDYVAHLEACDDLFPTRLSERVDLRAYAEKLHDRATSFELWQDDRLVGLLSAYMDTDVAFISHICVLPEVPAGSGHTLLDALADEMKRTGKRVVRLHVEADNDRAIRFYNRHGFLEIGRLNRDIIMERA